MNEELGILHRDLKPDNIMININPLKVKIIDFGTCKDLTVESGPHTSYVSTRWYRAPECVLRSHTYTFNSDIFAVSLKCFIFANFALVSVCFVNMHLNIFLEI